MEVQAREILALGARYVLIKGGHARIGESDESVDLLIGQGEVVRPVGEADGDEKHPRHRLHVVVGDCGGAGQGARRRDGVLRRPRPTSPRRSPHADELKIGHGPGPLHHFYRHWSTP